MATVKKYLLPGLAVLMMGFALLHVVSAQQSPPPLDPPIDPARNPYSHTVAGIGIVEAQTENISVGSLLPGVVTKVFVKVGDRVKAGDKLFQLDDRALQAEKKVREAALASAQAQLKRLKEMPRREEVPPLEASVAEARANLVEQEDLVKRTRGLYARAAVAEEELIRREQACRAAKEQLRRAETQLALLNAGAWARDIEVSSRAVDLSAAQLQQTQTDLDRLVVRAQVDGEVLQVNVRPGEYAGTPPTQTLILLGDVREKHVRADIDEYDIPRFRAHAPAEATLRGQPNIKYKLRFVRIEHYVLPKKSLTGDTKERVDTRVMQVIYALERPLGSEPVEGGKHGSTALFVEPLVGQQVDVFIKTDAPEPNAQ